MRLSWMDNILVHIQVIYVVQVIYNISMLLFTAAVEYQLECPRLHKSITYNRKKRILDFKFFKNSANRGTFLHTVVPYAPSKLAEFTYV